MMRRTSSAINPAVNCIMFMGDTGQPDGIKDHTKRPDNIIHIGVAPGNLGGQPSVPRATVP